jgi:hypothetical protein
MPKSKVVILKGGSHYAAEEQTDLVVTELNGFMDDI